MGTKIVVVHLKEIIKTAVFAIVGVALIVLLIYLFIPSEEDSESTEYVPGTYSAEIILHNNPVSVQVSVSENEILDIQLLNMGETQEVFYPLFQTTLDELSAQIIENQTLDVFYEEDKSMTSDILLKAIKSALAEAKTEKETTLQQTSVDE